MRCVGTLCFFQQLQRTAATSHQLQQPLITSADGCLAKALWHWVPRMRLQGELPRGRKRKEICKRTFPSEHGHISIPGYHANARLCESTCLSEVACIAFQLFHRLVTSVTICSRQFEGGHWRGIIFLGRPRGGFIWMIYTFLVHPSIKQVGTELSQKEVTDHSLGTETLLLWVFPTIYRAQNPETLKSLKKVSREECWTLRPRIPKSSKRVPKAKKSVNSNSFLDFQTCFRTFGGVPGRSQTPLRRLLWDFRGVGVLGSVDGGWDSSKESEDFPSKNVMSNSGF